MIVAKKLKSADDFMYHMYVHLNSVDKFAIFSGLKLTQFMAAFEPLHHLLLLKHTYEDSSFNMHTQFEYIPEDEVTRFVKKSAELKELCWIDFLDEKGLDQLTPVEQGELLYISHKKEPITSPFFNKLQNRFVYYSSDVGKMTKVYFRHLSDADLLIANVMNSLIEERERTTSFWRRKVKSRVPAISPESLRNYRPYVSDGALLSLYRIEKPKVAYAIEIRNLADYSFLDEVWDDLEAILKNKHDELMYIV
ncbi:hypothetical protein [Lysinibacillus piscis]|uniref:Uncharacterized protein n=1 Tax=Lysinibacillus piscis TaxID=2518931 RepID=A0ABQ5NM23_9BACI|nr:hypothetical protein [Lysinibacillus sp. KH24]GLC89410.1 hypothetical protein LYSBPC_25370 [Lysinibacillus sp. KH24]